MQPEMILKSDVLDILFENRNKDYGAYILRREYDDRVKKSLIVTFSLTALALLLLFNSFKKEQQQRPLISINGPTVLPPPIVPENKKIKHQVKKTVTSKKSITPVASIKIPTKPVVVADNKADVNIPTVAEADKKNISDKNSLGADNKGLQNVAAGESGIGSGAPEKADATLPINNPDVWPKFPGGEEALKRFLEKNLSKNNEVEDGQEISVKVRFIVGYDGSISGFDVIESGGDKFDDEVLRVLKRMPHWIPGKTNGKDVAVYYIVPVRFVND